MVQMNKIVLSNTATKMALAFHVANWKKDILAQYTGNKDIQFAPYYLNDRAFRRLWKQMGGAEKISEFLVWGLNLPEEAGKLARQHNIPVTYIEDGFIRSFEQSASLTPPLSLTFDRHTLYFDARLESDLERLLNSYDFSADTGLMQRAEACLERFLNANVSKYNSVENFDIEAVYGAKTGKRILVIGQSEGDASLAYGSEHIRLNNDLVQLAARENPDCQIIYKPHPDTLRQFSKNRSNPADVAHLCTILTQNIPLPQALQTIDHVYTITSLAGFEALLRGVPVTTAGCPFYAGWGLTDDRQASPRRTKKLTITELFAGAYIKYPIYYDPRTGKQVDLETTLSLVENWDGAVSNMKPPEPRPAWKPWGAYGILGWRHILPFFVTPFIKRIGTKKDIAYYRRYPIIFFRETPNATHRLIGRILYPFNE